MSAWRRWMIILAASLVVLSPGFAAAQDEPKVDVEFDEFKLVRTRNIFDPDRRVAAPGGRTPPAAAERRSSFLGVTGTMVTPTKSLAFFTGSLSDYNKVAGIGERVADFSVTSITSTAVELERDGKKLSVAVGRRLSLEAGGEPRATESLQPGSDTAPVPPLATPADDAPPSGVPAGKEDVLRRMMERRQKENAQ